MKYLHTMIRISDVEKSLRFFCEGLGLKETRRMENDKGRFTLIFLAAPHDEKARVGEESSGNGRMEGIVSPGLRDVRGHGEGQHCAVRQECDDSL